MKANKILAVAFATLALVGFNSCDKPGEDPKDPTDDKELTLDKSSLTLKMDEEGIITASVEAEWTVNNNKVEIKADGKTCKVTAKALGNAIVSATANGKTKTCVVAVKAASEGDGSVKGSRVWVWVLDGDAYKANEAKIVTSFQEDQVNNMFYIWPNTGDSYIGGNGEGLNSLGNTGYTALVVGTIGWSGAGFCCLETGESWKAAEELRQEIVENPDNFFLHIAIKSTTPGDHTFYFLENEGTKFTLGAADFDGGKKFADFDRDGAWHEFDIPMSNYADVLAKGTFKPGNNSLSFVSGGVSGQQLNLDAVYMYEK